MAKKNKKERLNIVYSTNKDFDFDANDEDEEVFVDPKEQTLKVLIDRKQRKGKAVTIIQDFQGSDEDLKDLAKELKAACGVGGTAKDGEILIQGEFRDKIMVLLQKKGFKTKRVGG